MKKEVAIYIRVSSEDQKKEGLSLEAQENKLKQYCQLNELSIFRVYRDEGKSAKSIKGRKQFIELINDAKQKKFSAVIVTKLDRAFRNVRDALNTLDEFGNIGIDFISLSEKIDTTSSFGKLLFTIISAFAQLERELTADRNKIIMENKFNQGIPIARIPFGYKSIYKNKKERKGVIGIEIDSKDSDVVKEIFWMATHGCDYKEICKKFNLAPQSYYNILRNKFYIGIVEFQGQEKQGIHEPIITKEMFYSINEKC